MSKANKKKSKQLKMSIGTASNRLRKMLLFEFVKRLELDVCYHCGKQIRDIDRFSIEHKTPWLDSDDPVHLFFDLDNIAFSHMSCNIGAARKSEPAKHGTVSRYGKHGCRCDKCKKAKAQYGKKWRKKKNGSMA